MNRETRRHPDKTSADPAECSMSLDELLSPNFTPKRQPPTPTRAGQSLGGLRAAANMTPEARHERAARAARIGAEKRRAERAAAGLPPARKRPLEPSAEELEPWLAEVDRRWPDRRWTSEARRRQAIVLARTAIAETVAEAFKNRGPE